MQTQVVHGYCHLSLRKVMSRVSNHFINIFIYYIYLIHVCILYVYDKLVSILLFYLISGISQVPKIFKIFKNNGYKI